jgi:glycosyltransferase involved in cell wall biosynthesis
VFLSKLSYNFPMTPKNTLIILSPGFAANEEDTTRLPPQQVFVKALNRNFPSLQIIILAFQYPRFKKQYKWFGNDVISFNGADKRRFFRVLLWIRVHNVLKKLHRQNNITGLLSFWCTECALVGRRFTEKHKLKMVCWILGQDAKKNNIYIRLIKPAPHELIALSDLVAEVFFKNHGIKPAYVITNGIDVNMFSKCEQPRTIDIMGAGSLIPIKRYDIFIEVVAAIKKVFPFVSSILCGSGPEENTLKEITHQRNLEKNITYAGKKPHTQVLALMQQSKIFLHPSSYEGFGVVCLEALYAGAHVISFCKPMIKNIDHWHIVESKEEMVKKTLEILCDRQAEYEPVLVSSIDESAKAVMRIFNY